jgi:hypothetical protein
MKNNIIVFLVCIPLISIGQNKPTLKETIDFLKPKLSQTFYNSGYAECTFEFDYKTNTITYTKKGTTGIKNNVEFTFIYKIPLKMVNLKDIAYYDFGSNIELKINNEEKLITFDNTYDGSRSVEKRATASITINKWDFEKIKEALIHAIRLCGGKGEAF